MGISRMANESVEVKTIPAVDGKYRAHVRAIKNGRVLLDEVLPVTFDTELEAKINGDRAGQRALSTG
jgi:hypothetical protein